MESLADFLGITPVKEGEQPSQPQKFTSAKAFCRALLASSEYRESLARRMTLGVLPPAVEVRLWDYAYGKPVEKIEIEDKTQAAAMSKHDIEQRIAVLHSLLQELPDDRTESIH